MKFKNGIFFKVEPLKTYEIDLPKEDVIYRLREQDGYCRNENSEKRTIEFVCSKKGDFLVKDLNYYINQLVFLQGKTVARNEKTVVEVFTVKSRGVLVEGIVDAFFSIVSIGICFWVMFRFLNDIKDMVFELFIILGLLAVMTLFSLARLIKKKKAIPVDTDIMLNEIEQRINGVVRWDD